jgi:hypothetical protein
LLKVMTTTSANIAGFVLEQIERAKALRLAGARSPARKQQRERLRNWQAKRLAHTHRDLLHDPSHRPAVEFFLSEIYGPQDTSVRDASVERIYPVIIRMLPERALHAIGLALELDALTEHLDDKLLDTLALDARSEITAAAYASAYRRCDNYALRKHQIELITRIGLHLAEIVRKPLVYEVLHAMRTPAHLAGFGELQRFLERGFDTFRRIPDPEKFVDLVERRETLILDRIYAGGEQPFEIDGLAELR